LRPMWLEPLGLVDLVDLHRGTFMITDVGCGVLDAW
jgi:hypothetical protein